MLDSQEFWQWSSAGKQGSIPSWNSLILMVQVKFPLFKSLSGSQKCFFTLSHEGINLCFMTSEMTLPLQIWHDFLIDLISFPDNWHNNMLSFKRYIILIKKKNQNLKTGLKSSTKSVLVSKYKGDKIRNKSLFCTHLHIYEYCKTIPNFMS